METCGGNLKDIKNARTKAEQRVRENDGSNGSIEVVVVTQHTPDDEWLSGKSGMMHVSRARCQMEEGERHIKKMRRKARLMRGV